jgi:small subunit ribosomal protein S9
MDKKEQKTTKKVENKIVKKTVVKTAKVSVKPPIKKITVENAEKREDEGKVVTPVKAPVVNKPKSKTSPPPPKKKELIYQGVGRRKTAIARVRLAVNSDSKEKTFTVNGRPVEQYFSLPQYKKVMTEPLRTTNTLNRFDISVKIAGSGLSSQLDAMIHGLSRALTQVDPERFKKILRKRGFMTRDPRAKERSKVGLMGARRVKQSPKR